MQPPSLLRGRLKFHVATTSFAFGLAIASFLVWSASVDRQSTTVLRLAALGLVVTWTGFLAWLFRGMLHQQISSGYCTFLFFGAWTVFFLIYNCLL